MPPEKKPTAPANRVYKSSVPLEQSRFPLRTTRVKYGKQASKKVQKQETLTQMDFVTNQRLLDEGHDSLGIYEDEPDKPKKKRRKTTGDEPSSESKYHTQTITQLDWSFTSEQKVGDSIYDVRSSSLESKQCRQNAAQSANPQRPAIRTSSRRTSAPGLMGPPQTPHTKRSWEIPCSESPATPPSRTYSFKASALQERSINIPIQFNTGPKPAPSPSTLPRLRIEDTFESEDATPQTHISTTPSKRSSPAKSVRWAEVDEIRQVGELPATEDGKVIEPVTTKKLSTHLRDEIMDSEDEDGDYEDSEKGLSEEDTADLPPETCYGEVGLETQKLLAIQEIEASPCMEESETLGENTTVDLLDRNHPVVGSQTIGEEEQESLAEKTQYMESQRLATQHVHAMAPRTKASDVFVSIQPQNVTKIVNRTRNHEFRKQVIPSTVSRIWIYETYPTRVLQYMAVISPAKRPGEIMNEDGVGNAEFNAKDPNCGEFAWEILELYELADPVPWDTIEANEWLSGPPRRPTFVRPAVLDQLMANLKPPIFCRTPLVSHFSVSSSTDTQEADEQLLHTMIQYTQPSSSLAGPSSSHILKEEDQDDEYADADEEPSNSTPQASSRLVTIPSGAHSDEADEGDDDQERTRSTPQLILQASMPPPKEHGTQCSQPELPRPSQAETVDLSQSPTPQPQKTTADIVFESPTRPTFSSPQITLPTLRNNDHSGPDTLLPYSLSSSQLLTKSQMLPAALFNDSVPGPPLFIQDSDDEDEDEL